MDEYLEDMVSLLKELEKESQDPDPAIRMQAMMERGKLLRVLLAKSATMVIKE